MGQGRRKDARKAHERVRDRVRYRGRDVMGVGAGWAQILGLVLGPVVGIGLLRHFLPGIVE
mgnify:CR=1 FL=1